MVAALLGDDLGDADWALDEFRRRYAATPTPPASLYPGVRRGLRALNDAGVGVAVWSNKPQSLCDKVLADLNLSDLCCAIVGTGPAVPHKPDPTGYDLALTKAGGDRGASCMVGDTLLDHAAARNVHAPFVWVSYGYGETAPGDAHVANDFAAAASIVIQLLGER
jgi:phosphoglycolate phosphatase